jgi:hypothetical protein
LFRCIASALTRVHCRPLPLWSGNGSARDTCAPPDPLPLEAPPKRIEHMRCASIADAPSHHKTLLLQRAAACRICRPKATPPDITYYSVKPTCAVPFGAHLCFLMNWLLLSLKCIATRTLPRYAGGPGEVRASEARPFRNT